MEGLQRALRARKITIVNWPVEDEQPSTLEIVCWKLANSPQVIDHLLEKGQDPFGQNDMIPDPQLSQADITVSDAVFKVGCFVVQASDPIFALLKHLKNHV